MFRELFRGIRKGGIASEVNTILTRNYCLQANNDQLLNYIMIFAEIHGNPHELAIGYVTNQIILMDRTNPGHIKIATKYIRVAKQAYKVGVARNDWAIDELRENAMKYLGLNINSIDAEPC